MTCVEEQLLEYLRSFNFPTVHSNPKSRKDISGGTGVPINTLTFGLTHKMFTREIGDSVSCEKYPELYKLLQEYGYYLNGNLKFTKITLNKNFECKPHKDSKNRGITMIKSLGQYTGGLLCLEDGRKIDLRHGPFYFNGNKIQHWVEPFQGERYTIVYYNSIHFHPVYRQDIACDSKVLSEIFKKNEYTKYFGQELGETWADIGANIGAFTLRNQMNGIKTISFEPDPGNFDILIQNSVNPDLCYRKAVVAKSDGSVKMYVNAKNPWNNTIVRPVRGRTSIDVETIAFQDATVGCDCVKIDIEGGEFDILDNCEMGGFKKLIIAYHINYDHSRSNLIARIEKLKQLYVVQHNKIPDTEYLDFFPNEIMIYCNPH